VLLLQGSTYTPFQCRASVAVTFDSLSYKLLGALARRQKKEVLDHQNLPNSIIANNLLNLKAVGGACCIYVILLRIKTYDAIVHKGNNLYQIFRCLV